MVSGTVLVIGAGSIGKRHAGNLERLGVRAELLPWRACDLDTLARRDDVAAVVIATATQIRLELVQLCAEKGWPFYAEKPLAWRLDQAQAVHAAAAPVADRSMVGFMMRYHPAVQDLAARNLSQIYGFSFEIGHDVRQWRANWRFADSYAANPQGGGVLLDLSHELDMALALFPGLTVQSAQSIGHVGFPGVDFATRIALAAPDGAVGTVAMDYLSPVSLRRAALRGMDGILDLDFLAPALTHATPTGSDTQRYSFDRNDMFLSAMRDFLALVEGRAPSDNPLLPRFDRMEASTHLIASAWEARNFTAHLSHDMG
ncbi:MAG: Gfo/Idh/MocA family oxidoreductase [Rhodobacteraceae bacterium]|nr:Gfo/Idh/MocA family oxidoreductase [Paracoccaceae bacterium]